MTKQELRERLVAIFEAATPRQEYTFQHLLLKTGSPPIEWLALALDELAREGFIERVFRVESPYTQAGIGDFPTVDEVPEVIYDYSTDSDISVGPSIVHPIFKTA